MGNVNQYNECESKKYERETEKKPNHFYWDWIDTFVTIVWVNFPFMATLFIVLVKSLISNPCNIIYNSISLSPWTLLFFVLIKLANTFHSFL